MSLKSLVLRSSIERAPRRYSSLAKFLPTISYAVPGELTDAINVFEHSNCSRFLGVLVERTALSAGKELVDLELVQLDSKPLPYLQCYSQCP